MGEIGDAPSVAARRKELLAKTPVPQPDCPLFASLPPELRHRIFRHVLADFPSTKPERRYSRHQLYYRPGLEAWRDSDNALLRTCRLVYAECWLMPFLVRTHIHYLTDNIPDWGEPEPETPEDDYLRRRHRYTAEVFADWAYYYRQQTGHDDACPEVERLQVFATVWSLANNRLAALLATPTIRPRRLVLTVRYQDWAPVFEDRPLQMPGGWLRPLSKTLPSSVRVFCLELETVRRKAEQVDDMARQIRDAWFVKRTDGVVLFPDATGTANGQEVCSWRGSSIRYGQQWVRDECAPGLVEYHVLRIPFRPRPEVLREGGQVSEQARLAAERDAYDQADLRPRDEAIHQLPLDDRPVWIFPSPELLAE